MKTGATAGTPPAQAASPAAGSILTGAAGLFGAAVGGSMVQPLPPMPKRAEIKPLVDDNENAEDAGVRRAVSSAQDILSQYSRERPRKGPPPASQAQVAATVAELTPFTTFERIDRVMQVVSTPNCSTDNGHQSCILCVIHAPHAGVAVQRSQFTFLDGHVVEKDGRVIDSTLYFSAGGTPPAGPRTGAR